jgi:type I site-specific restriction-modification system R (restriction) subunit
LTPACWHWCERFKTGKSGVSLCPHYRRDRDPREKLFEFGRCVVHFAVDDAEVRMCAELRGKGSWFLPFNKGWNDGAGNPPNPAGLKTDSLWREVLTPSGLTNILENYAQVIETKNPKTGRKRRAQVFPRYHQLGVVRQTLAHVAANGAGSRYLIQHSAGSGKSNSIAWLAHQLIALKRDEKEIFDSVSYYKLVKKIEGDPEFDTKRAQKKLRKYVESHDYAIRLKAEIMVDHFHEQVMALNKIGGKARAMLVCNGIERAVQYFHAFQTYLVERKSPYQAIVAFSGEFEYGGINVSESSLNGFSSGDIAEKIQEDPYRFLICADKFQTGYDEPLLHTMYVDKPLAGIKAVQTLSRLNRAHPEKHDVFVLDFQNNTETITEAFADYYRTTVLSEETDPNKLHDLKAALDSAQVYSPEQVQRLVDLFLSGAARETLDHRR